MQTNAVGNKRNQPYSECIRPRWHFALFAYVAIATKPVHRLHADLPNSAQPGAPPICHPPKLHPVRRAIAYECGEGQTHTHTHTDGRRHNTFRLAVSNAKCQHKSPNVFICLSSCFISSAFRSWSDAIVFTMLATSFSAEEPAVSSHPSSSFWCWLSERIFTSSVAEPHTAVSFVMGWAPASDDRKFTCR